jgi:hypothetical protein
MEFTKPIQLIKVTAYKRSLTSNSDLISKIEYQNHLINSLEIRLMPIFGFNVNGYKSQILSYSQFKKEKNTSYFFREISQYKCDLDKLTNSKIINLNERSSNKALIKNLRVIINNLLTIYSYKVIITDNEKKKSL